MSIAPVSNLPKDEIVWLALHRCKHRHAYLNHYECYMQERPIRERIGFVDIETGNLKASIGYIFSYCIKDHHGKILSRVLTPDEVRSGVFDRELLKQFIKDIQGFDRLVGYYSTGFDIPFIRTRCEIMGVPGFPTFGEKRHTDLFYIIKSRFKFHRSSLQVACEELGIPAKQHRFTGKVWQKACAGDPKALKHILVHNKEDVISTEMLYDRVMKYSKMNKACI